MRRDQPIDILQLYSTSDYVKWNAFLNECLRLHDVDKLINVRYRLQLGMDKLTKAKLDTEKIAIFFLRIQKSIDDTLKQIYRKKNPNPLYDDKNKHLYSEFIQEKRRGQVELERFIQSKTF